MNEEEDDAVPNTYSGLSMYFGMASTRDISAEIKIGLTCKHNADNTYPVPDSQCVRPNNVLRTYQDVAVSDKSVMLSRPHGGRVAHVLHLQKKGKAGNGARRIGVGRRGGRETQGQKNQSHQGHKRASYHEVGSRMPCQSRTNNLSHKRMNPFLSSSQLWTIAQCVL